MRAFLAHLSMESLEKRATELDTEIMNLESKLVKKRNELVLIEEEIEFRMIPRSAENLHK